MKYVLDTTAYSELLKDTVPWRRWLIVQRNYWYPSRYSGIRYGFRLGSKQLENEKLLSRFLANKKSSGFVEQCHHKLFH